VPGTEHRIGFDCLRGARNVTSSEKGRGGVLSELCEKQARNTKRAVIRKEEICSKCGAWASSLEASESD
jgi:hypothetical protein